MHQYQNLTSDATFSVSIDTGYGSNTISLTDSNTTFLVSDTAITGDRSDTFSEICEILKYFQY